jgi:ActR/RegA family two-component response regulator
MGESGNGKVGTVLLVSRDCAASERITEVLQGQALSVESSVDTSAGLQRLNRRKFEAVVVDLSIGEQANSFLQQIRTSASNRTAVCFAITSSSHQTARALKQGFSFALEKPLTVESISHTLKVAYGLIVRERRRYFRYPIVVPVALSVKVSPPPEIIYGRTVNVSEGGMAVSTPISITRGLQGTAQCTLPDTSPLRITAEFKACWNKANGECGLSFLFVPFDVASALQAWLARKLEEQLPQAVADRFRAT